MNYKSILCVAALLLLFAPATSAAGATSATATVRKANTTVRDLLRRKVKAGSSAEKALANKLTTRVRNFLDIDELGRRALKNHWASLPSEQRAEYLKLLRGLIAKNYVDGLRSNLQYEVSYLGESKTEQRTVVKTEIKTKRRGRPYTVSVDYVVRRSATGWRAFDIVTDGVGLVANYRAQFNRIIANKGFDDLLRRMRKRLARLGA